MNKSLLIGLFLSILSGINIISAAASSQEIPETPSLVRYFNPHKRPAELETAISDTFRQLSSKKGSPNDDEAGWAHNGKTEYWFGNITSSQTLIHYIETHTDQVEFTFVDAGAGNFAWCSSMANRLATHFKASDRQLIINIVGLRGEQNEPGELSQQRIGICNIYQWGAFFLENFSTAWNHKWYETGTKKKSIDIVWTQWTLRHCNDPFGTLIQITEDMCEDSWCFGDGAFVKFNKQSQKVDSEEANSNWTSLLQATGNPVLIEPYELGRSLDRFAFQKKVSTHIPLQYEDKQLLLSDDYHQINSRRISIFTPLEGFPPLIPIESLPKISPTRYTYLYGDKNLFEWLKPLYD